MKKSITCPTLEGTLSRKSVPAIEGHSERWYGRVPANVLFDKDISDGAKVLFGIMSLKVFQGNVTTVGVRHLATMTGKSKSVIHRLITELVTIGHVAPSPETKRGQRGFYTLTSPVFAQKQRAGVQEIVSSPSGGRRLASVRSA